jgi:ankyrin repeat protein
MMLSPNTSITHKNPELWTAVMLHDRVRVIELLESGANTEDVGSNGSTALIDAARVADIDMFRILLDFGANCNAVNSSGQGVLHSVICKLPCMVSSRPGCNRQYNTVDVREEMCKMLLLKGVAVDATDIHGETALHYVSRHKGMHFFDAMVSLLQHNCYVSARNYESHTPLYLSITGGCVAKIQYLIDHGADVNERYSSAKLNDIPLSIAMKASSWHNNNFDIVKLLIEQGADNMAIDSFGKTAVESAIASHRVEMADMITACAELRNMQRRLALAMAFHERLGEVSSMNVMSTDVFQRHISP